MQVTLKNKYKGYGTTALLFLLIFLFLKQLSLINKGIYAALTLCARTIIPSLFPFLILTECLLSSPTAQSILCAISTPASRLLRLSKAGGNCFLLGNLFGFPVGAKAVASYYQSGLLNKKEAERLLLFCGNASPFFLIGSVGGGMLNSLHTGVFLYFLQLFISFLIGVFSRRLAPSQEQLANTVIAKNKKGIAEIIQGASLQTLYICGYILFFSAISAALLPCLKSDTLAVFMVSLLEIGNASALAAGIPATMSVAFCAFATSFSGLSVYFQTLDVIQDTDLKTTLYLPVKMLSGAVAFFIAKLFY